MNCTSRNGVNVPMSLAAIVCHVEIFISFFSVKAFEYCSSFLNFTNFSSFLFVSLPFYCCHSLMSLLDCLFFPSLIQMRIFWIVFFFLWFHEFFMFSLPFYYYHSLLDCLFFHQVQCLSLKCAIIYYCWLLGAVVVAWGVAGSVKMLISITLRPRSIGSVISSPLLVQTCSLGSVWLCNFFECGSEPVK